MSKTRKLIVETELRPKLIKFTEVKDKKTVNSYTGEEKDLEIDPPR